MIYTNKQGEVLSTDMKYPPSPEQMANAEREPIAPLRVYLKNWSRNGGSGILKGGNRIAEIFKIACIVNVSCIYRVVKNMSENNTAKPKIQISNNDETK